METKQITVTVTTAHKLSASQRQQLESLLVEKLGSKTSIHERLDPDVIGGLKITIGDQEIDSSIAGQIQNIAPQVPELVVETALAIDEAKLKSLQKTLQGTFGEDVRLKVVVNPLLLGGIRLRFGSQEYDGSIRGKLDKLKKQLLQVGISQ